MVFNTIFSCIIVYMKSETIRKKFLDFFEKKGHTVIASSSLIPDDPTSLFTSAGMQQLVPYLTGEKDVVKEFGNRHLVSVQKCFRTGDIDEVGDDSHHTFFEMLGNWSVGGDYFKEGAIELALDFFCNELGVAPPIISYLPPAIITHAGPGSIAVGFFR